MLVAVHFPCLMPRTSTTTGLCPDCELRVTLCPDCGKCFDCHGDCDGPDEDTSSDPEL